MVRKLGRAEILAQIPAARAAGREAQREPWWPVAVRYDPVSDDVVIGMRGGKSLIVPRAHIPELREATVEQLGRVQPAGEAIRWDELDVDVSVPGLLSELLGPHLSTRASGRRGGAVRSPAKAAAARANGKKGGRPRK
ncbi:MAG TPA: DUF2442 domain-containing protein [Longimicrobiales bacterium]